MVSVRDAVADDAPACSAIYAPYVRDTAITFEFEPPGAAEFAVRIVAAQQRHVWLVAEQEGVVLGFAYAGAWRSRPAYAWSCETTVYLRAGVRRTGAGRALMVALLDRLAAMDYRQALAGVALPNPASVGLHEALGFRLVGTFERVGWKLDAWHDVAWYQRPLGTAHGGGDLRPRGAPTP